METHRVVFRCLSRLLQGLKEHPDNAFAEEIRAVAIAALEGKASPLEATSLSPITELRLTQKRCPVGFEMLSTSLDGKVANLNFGNDKAKQTLYLCFKRGTEPPITSIAVVHVSRNEEMPYGFTAMRSGEGQIEDLNAGSGPKVVLSYIRGEGAPLLDISVVFRERERARNALKPGWHEVRYTPLGGRANVSSGTTGVPCYFCVRPNLDPVLAPFRNLQHSLDLVGYSECMRALTMCLYSSEQRIVALGLESFKELVKVPVPPVVLNLFMHAVCDAVPLFLTYLTSSMHVVVLKFLYSISQDFMPWLGPSTIGKVIETCFLVRHEDKKSNVSKLLLEEILSRVSRCRPCPSHHVHPVKGSMGPSCFKCQWKEVTRADSTASFCRRLVDLMVFNACVSQQNVRLPHRSSSNSIAQRQDGLRIAANLHSLGEWSKFLLVPSRQRSSAGTHHNMNLYSDSINSSDDDTGSTSDADTSTKVMCLPPSPMVVGRADQAAAYPYTNKALESHYESILCAFMVLCCQRALEPSAFNLVKSELVKRKTHALYLLLHLVQQSGSFFTSGLHTLALLRFCLVPTILGGCVTDVPSVFRVLMQLFVMLWSSFRQDLIGELGVVIDRVFIPLLENPFCTLDQKREIVDVFFILLNTPKAVVNLFFNFDANCRGWKVFENLVTALGKLVEGYNPSKPRRPSNVPVEGLEVSDESKKDAPAQEPLMPPISIHIASLSSPRSVTSAPPVLPRDCSGVLEESEPDPAHSSLIQVQRHCLKLLVQILQMLAQWIGVPGVPGRRMEADISKEPPLFQDEKVSSEDVPLWLRCVWRNQHLEKIVSQALSVARCQSLKAGMKLLCSKVPLLGLPHQLASFLMLQPNALKPEEVGELLSLGDEGSLALRTAYFSLLDFRHLDFDAALRLCFQDCGFRLPGEAQKVDRIVQAFASAFCQANPCVFSSVDGAFVLVFALIVLNTDVHNPNQKMPPMSLDSFLKRLKDCHQEDIAPVEYITKLYHSIVDHALEWAERPRANQLQAQQLQDTVQSHKQFDLVARKGLAALIECVGKQTLERTDSSQLVHIILGTCWHKFIAAINAAYDRGSKDLDTVHACLEGLAYGTTISIVLGLNTERQAFSNLLAKMTFVEKHKGKGGDEEALATSRLSQHRHLKQDWYREVSVEYSRNRERACRTVMRMADTTKLDITKERKQAELRGIQLQFASVNLVDKKRFFSKDGVFLKLDRKGRLMKYHFFLFSDLILYASLKKNHVHRVIHLSLCRVMDLRAPDSAFRLISPQKTITVVMPSQLMKKQWMDLIVQFISQVVKERRTYLQRFLKQGVSSSSGGSLNIPTLCAPSVPSASSSSSSSSAPFLTFPAVAAPSSPSDASLISMSSEFILRRYSTFIGQDTFASSTSEVSTCKLCIRPFSIFRRKVKCPYCADFCCSLCTAQKVALDGSQRPVCDACYGVLGGMVQDTLPILSVEPDPKKPGKLS